MAISSTFSAGGRNFQLFTSNGTFTPPAGAKVFDVYIAGGGGGGAGGGYADGGTITSGWGGTGGGSGYVTVLRDLRISSSYTVTIGTGGAGGTGALAATPAWHGTAGSRGGTTSFGPYTSPGGGGGAINTTGTGSSQGFNASTNTQSAVVDTVKNQIVLQNGGGNSIVAAGGSGGSAGGGMTSSGPSRSSAGTTAVGSKTLNADGAIWGGSNHSTKNNIGGTLSNTTGSTLAYVSSIFLGQEFTAPSFNFISTNQPWIDPNIQRIGNLWYVAGGGGNGLGVSTTTLYGEGGFAGTDIAGGSQGLTASATVISQVGQTATTPSAGGGGGGGSYQTGTNAGNGGAGANGFVVVYW